MAYSVKQVDTAFKVKVDLGSDATGETALMSLSYFSDADITTDLSGGTVTFSEGATAGLYISSDITISTPGDYTFVVTHTTLGNTAMPVVVADASMDSIAAQLDTVQSTVDGISFNAAASIFA